MTTNRSTFRTSRRTGLAARGAAARGLSLAELSVSLVIVGILSVTLGSVMVLTGRAVALSATQAGEARVDDLVSTIASEQRFALSVTERTPKSITFTVADRDGDDAPETIRYAWSGLDGDPLTRQLNGGIPVTIVPSVHRFNLSYLVTTTAAAAPVADVESAEVPLYVYESGSSQSAVSTLSWVGQYFKPDWTAVAPGKTVSAWRVTRVEFVAAKPVGAIGSSAWYVRLYNPGTGTDMRPSGLPVEDQRLPIASLPVSGTASWITSPVAFSSNTGLDPSRGLCLVIGPQAFSPSGTVGFNSAGGGAGGAMLTSSNAGTTYNTPNASRSLRVRIYGRYKAPG
jgi:hypothetical protein